MTIDLKILKSSEYFTDLSENDLEIIKQYFTERRVRPYDIFLVSGEWSNYLYFLIEGIVKVSLAYPNGREQILHIATPYEALNIVSTFDGGYNHASIQALTPACLYVINKQNLKILLGKYPQISLNILKSLAARIRHDSNMVKTLSSGYVMTRLAMLLMGKFDGTPAGVSITLTKENMAGLIGTSRETIQRSLKIMEKQGAIKLEARRIKILSEGRLSELSEKYSYT